MKRNRFTRALHHLNKKNVVESAPTNSTLGVFNVIPSGVGPVGWTDRTFTTDISGNQLPKLAVADFTVGENPENATEARDTSGLFEDDGTIKTLTPPGDNSYILGPFSSMWYAWGNFTTLGYIRQSDRKMVNLGTITGKLSDWDGASINSYGQLTLEQALWFKDVKKFGDIDNDPANHNYRAFYPGPPSNTPDANGRYLCVIAASREEGGSETRPGAPDNPTEKGEMNPDDNLSQLLAKIKELQSDIDWDAVMNAVNLGMLALDVAAVVGLLFPEPATSVAGAARLLARLRSLKGLSAFARRRLTRASLNPLGQKAIRSGAAGRVRTPVYSGRPYKGPKKFPKKGPAYATPDKSTGQAFTNPNLKGAPGTGTKVNPKGTLDKGTLPQRYIDKYGSKTVFGQPQIKMSKSAYRRTFGNSYELGGSLIVENTSIDNRIDYFVQLLSKLPQEKIENFIDKLSDFVKSKKQIKESSSYNKQNLLREIVIPEAKKKYKVKPKVIGHPSNKTLSNQMKDTTPNVAFKKELPVWSMNQKMRNARTSQEKKNEVLEYLGSSGDHWNYMTKTIKEHNKKIIKLNYGGKKKKVTRKEQVDKDTLVFMEDELGNKSSVLQSKINEMQAEVGDKEMFAKYYEMNPQKKSLFKEVVKRGIFDYKGKPSKKGYPDKEPAQLDPKTGMHPEYGKKYKHDKLEPHSAESMPMQGDPEIDANIAKNVDQEKKKRKSKILSQPNG